MCDDMAGGVEGTIWLINLCRPAVNAEHELHGRMCCCHGDMGQDAPAEAFGSLSQTT